METIKLGSTGDAVKTLQKKLGITADGIFGIDTEAKVKAFQKAHDLTADGIVGVKTWKALGIAEESKCIDTSVIYKPLPVHVTKKSNRKIEYIVIHYTGGSSSKSGRAQGVYNTFMKRQASADFAVDDSDIVQFNPDLHNYYCWSVGDALNNNNGGKYHGKCYNNNSVSIEICSNCNPATSEAVSHGNHAGWSYTEASLDNARKLVRILMKKLNIDKSHVIRHYDVSGKLCPGILGWNNEPIKNTDGTKTGKMNNSLKWQEFLESI